MHLFRRKAPNLIQIVIDAPDSVTEDNVFLDVEATLSCETGIVKPTVKARLRADLTDKKKAKGAAQYYLLGEAEYMGQVDVVPDQPAKVSVRIPLDFSPMALFDIPSANMAMASPEMQSAMKAAQEIGHLYAYSVEVVAKTPDNESIARQPIELIRPDSTRIGSF